MKTQDELLDEFAGQITTCMYSETGCRRLPVRMVTTLPMSITGKQVEVEMAMLCMDHAKTYQPNGEVIADWMMPDEHIEFCEKHGC